MDDKLPPVDRLQRELDPTTEAEHAVINALAYHLSDVELGVLARMIEQGRRDRWPT